MGLIMWALVSLILIIVNIAIAIGSSWKDRYDAATFYLVMAVLLMVASIKHV